MIVHRDDDLVWADVLVRWHGMNFDLRTRNPKRRPEHMAIHLERGPFRHLTGEWRLKTLSEHGCKVDFTLDYEFDRVVMTQMAGPGLGRQANTLVDAFVRRTEGLAPLALLPPAPPAASPPPEPGRIPPPQPGTARHPAPPRGG
jgi:ribosome-associated toxin RatA of RatAB toxin-antitoxin module